MGSSTSSHVKNIQIDPTQKKGDPKRLDSQQKQREGSARQKSFRSGKVADEIENKTTSTIEKGAEEGSNQTAEELEKLLTESESQRLDLEDRVQILEEQLEYNKNQNLVREEKSCDETLHAKDQYIAKLEKEKADMETESNKMKQRSRKKIKMLSSKLSEFKQEANFQMMELWEEIAKLKEQNLALQDSSCEHKGVTASGGDGLDTVLGSGKMKLILELSAQVTEQNDKISKLERKLKDKDHIIDELRVKLKNNMEYLKARDEADNHRNVSNDKNNNNHLKSKSYLNGQSQNRKVAQSAIKNADSTQNDMNSLFAVTEEDSDDDFDDDTKMEKLSALLKGVKVNDKFRHSMDSLDDKLSDKDDLPNQTDARKYSGTSRDSGLGSAGKQRNANQKTLVPKYEEKEPSFSLESGLSDSDLEDFRNDSHSKITSAPPKLERNSQGHKLKKKSSLKRRLSQKNEKYSGKVHIPKPSLAFVNSEQDSLMADENMFTIPGSSSLSSVQVI